MTDWPSIVIPTAAGLLGAGLGGYGSWKAACKAGDDARALAAEQRRNDELERKAELARSDARNVHMLTTDALTKLYNVHEAARRMAAGNLTAQRGEQIIADATTACETLRRIVLLHSYLLPAPISERLTDLYALMSQATHLDLQGRFFDRAGADVQTYGRYVQLSLEAVVHDREVPLHQDPPRLDRESGPSWFPEPKPEGW